MLADKEHFDLIEKILTKNGTIDRFEKEQGKIRGRMMITLGDAPDIIRYNEKEDGVYVFTGTFDFYDMEIGVVLKTKPIEARSTIWFTPQKDGAEEPSQEWIEFFMKTLINSIGEDGSFGYPICTFASDTGDFTVIPTSDQE